MKNGDRDPEDEQGKGSNAAGKGIGEDHASSRTAVLRRTGNLLVQHLIETIQDASDPNDNVAESPRGCLMLGWSLGSTSTSARFRAVLARCCIAICNDQYTDDGDGDSADFTPPQLLLQQGYAKSVRKEGRAIVNGRQIGRGGHIYGDVPAPASNGKSTGDEEGRPDHIGDRIGGTNRRMDGLILHHLCSLPKHLDVTSPEWLPRLVPFGESENTELSGPQ